MGVTATPHPRSAPLRLSLPSRALRLLREAGIACRPEVTLAYQQRARRHVVRGMESGGAAGALGRYVAFADDAGEPLPWLQPLDALAPNGAHAVVVAPALVSAEVFRHERTYDLLIARHAPETSDGRARLRSETLFRGRSGYLPLDLTGADRAMAGTIAPEFFTRAGERQEVPERFQRMVRLVTQAVNTIGCRRAVCAHAVPVDPLAEMTSGPEGGEA